MRQNSNLSRKAMSPRIHTRGNVSFDSRSVYSIPDLLAGHGKTEEAKQAARILQPDFLINYSDYLLHLAKAMIKAQRIPEDNIRSQAYIELVKVFSRLGKFYTARNFANSILSSGGRCLHMMF